MADPDLKLKLRRRESVICRHLRDRALLLDPQTGRCFELNRIGVEVWARLDGSATLEQVCCQVQVTVEPGISLERLQLDVRAFGRELEQSGLAEQNP
jgi:hypothetical protein